jgi:hypothetical protein
VAADDNGGCDKLFVDLALFCGTSCAGRECGMTAARWLAVLSAVCGAVTAQAAGMGGVEGETLVQTMPGGYKVGSHQQSDGMTMQEMVPAEESVDNWSKMITTQVFPGKGNWLPSDFLIGFGQRVGAVCPGMTHSDVMVGASNRYVTGLVMLRCPVNRLTGKPETIVARAIQGKDSFYLVQIAYRYAPTHADSRFTESYLRSIIVCDTRSNDHPCPDLGGNGLRDKP